MLFLFLARWNKRLMVNFVVAIKTNSRCTGQQREREREKKRGNFFFLFNCWFLIKAREKGERERKWPPWIKGKFNDARISQPKIHRAEYYEGNKKKERSYLCSKGYILDGGGSLGTGIIVCRRNIQWSNGMQYYFCYMRLISFPNIILFLFFRERKKRSSAAVVVAVKVQLAYI